jgi:hypothetical protein
MYIQHAAVHDDLTASLPSAKVIEWEETPTKASPGRDGKWSSPMMDPVWTGTYAHKKNKMDLSGKLYAMSLKKN